MPWNITIVNHKYTNVYALENPIFNKFSIKFNIHINVMCQYWLTIMKGIGAVDSGSDIIKSCNKRGAVTLEEKKTIIYTGSTRIQWKIVMERGDSNKRGYKWISMVNEILNWYILLCTINRVFNIVPIWDIMYQYFIEINQGGAKQQNMLYWRTTHYMYTTQGHLMIYKVVSETLTGAAHHYRGVTYNTTCGKGY